MEDSKNLNHHDESLDKNIEKDTVEIKNKEKNTIPHSNNFLNENNDLKVNPTKKSVNDGTNQKKFVDNKKVELGTKLNTNVDETIDSVTEVSNQIINEKSPKDNISTISEAKLDKSSEMIEKVNKEITNDKKSETNKKIDLSVKSNIEIDKAKINNNSKQLSTSTPVKPKTKPVKEPPIEKKPFLEFVNDYLIPAIKNEFKLKGKEINKIDLQKTHRPIAEDICWVIYCEINDTCNFWLSFEKDDITSLKSFSLCKNYEKPSIIESFLIDEKKITLKLIISRILQRLNGQKLIGAN